MPERCANSENKEKEYDELNSDQYAGVNDDGGVLFF